MVASPESFLSLLGGFPDRPPLDLRVRETEQENGYCRHRIDYVTVPGERVEAFLLVPDDAEGRLPGLVAIHQDGGVRPYSHGKSEVAGLGSDPELAYGLEACLRGYVVICPDRFGFESRSLSRSPFAAQFADFRIEGSATGLDLTEDLYKGCVANRLLFQGWTALGKELFELSRAVDCLVSLDYVEPDRIGAIGHSAGGLLTAYLMFVDERVGVGCASCGTWLIRDAFRDDYLRPMQGFGSALAVPGMGNWGDTDDVLAGIAPRPFCEARGDADPDEDLALLVGKAHARYAEQGASERFRYVRHTAGHVFPAACREQAYDWLDRWLR